MADNYVNRGDILDAIAPAGGLTSGLAFAMKDVVAVPQIDGVEGDTVPCGVKGVYLLPLASGGSDLEAGTKVNFDESTGEITAAAVAVAGDITECGIVARNCLAADTTVEVLLTPGTGTTAS